LEQRFKSIIVWLILDGKTEKALHLLSDKYGVDVPKLEVGLPKRHKKNSLGCYDGKRKTISVLNSDVFKNPFVILHEFYHHLRTNLEAEHKGTEKYANEFAADFIQAYNSVVAEYTRNNQ
jgi:hypothetical protein